MTNISIKVLSVNISEKKGVVKHQVDSIKLDSKGVQTDAHAGDWNRQVSLLGQESVDRFEKQAGRKIAFGEFAENITTQGLELFKTHPLDRFIGENVTLEVTQIGKKCHGDNCAIYREVGNCVMPKEGIFCRVIKQGTLRSEDVFVYEPKVYNVKIITLSDRASIGEYADLSGPRIKDLLKSFFEEKQIPVEFDLQVIPDNEVMLMELMEKTKKDKMDFLFTTGGTGIGPRDITPEIVKVFLDKEIPGIMDLIRIKYGQEKPGALLSRSTAGLMGSTIVYTLPGSVKAVEEYISEITKTMLHLVYTINRLDVH